MSLVLFIIISLVFRDAGRYLTINEAGEPGVSFQLFSLALITTLALLLRGLFLLKLLTVKLIVAVFSLTTLWGIFLLIRLAPSTAEVYLKVFAIYIAIPALAIRYLTRNSFITLCKQYTAYRDLEAMRKFVQKQLSKR